MSFLLRLRYAIEIVQFNSKLNFKDFAYNFALQIQIILDSLASTIGEDDNIMAMGVDGKRRSILCALDRFHVNLPMMLKR